MTRTSKKYMAAVAGILILLYHCYVPLFSFGSTAGNIERFILTTSYIGVDIFFFISAYSLAARPVLPANSAEPNAAGSKKEQTRTYLKFVANRAIKVLPLFFIALLFKKFLWFIPAIMLVYLVFPLAYKACSNKSRISFYLLIAIWAGTTYLVLGVIKPFKDYGIFLFRIPIIILGAYAAKFDQEGVIEQKGLRKGLFTNKLKLLLGTVLLILGTLALYKWGYLNRLNVPFKGTFYLVGIPSTIAVVMIIDAAVNILHNDTASSNHQTETAKGTIIEMIGSMTLELYFTQMVIGTFLTNTFFKLFHSKLLTNLATIIVVTIVALVIHKGYERVLKKVT